jgi:hypothetical protein
MTTWGTPLEPGDLILVRDGAPYGRRASSFDRIGLVVASGGVAVEEPATQRVAVSRALRSAHAPLVLRPTWRSRTSRDSFVSWFEGLVERRVQASRTPRLLFRLMLKHSLRGAMPLERVPIDRASWDSCRAVFLSLDRQGRELVELASAGGPRRPLPPLPSGPRPEPRASVLTLA